MMLSSTPTVFGLCSHLTLAVAFFLKYIGAENLNKAYDEFEVRSLRFSYPNLKVECHWPLHPLQSRSRDPEIRAMLRRTKNEYSEQLVSAASLQPADDGEAVRPIIDALGERAALLVPESPMAILMRLTAAWMRNRLEVLSVPLGELGVRHDAVHSCSEDT